eukprot:1713666-Pyramimonas_sp.AAC.1
MGGEGRTTKMLLRRMHHEGLRAGKNFDVQCGVEWFNAQERAGMWKYLELCQPVVVAMSPPCQGMASWAAFNKMMNPETQQALRRTSEPLGHLCGGVVRYQVQHGRRYLSEQPAGSELYDSPIWVEMRSPPNTAEAIIHQCQGGLRCPRTGLPVQKPTHFAASCKVLVFSLRRLRCEGRRACHKHQHVDGPISRKMQ